MKTKLLASIALLGLSVGSAQAVTLNYTDSHTFDGEVDFFYFDNNSTGNVSLWTDTLQDGFDSAGALFKLNAGTGQYDFMTDIAGGAQSAFDPLVGYNTDGINDFGVAIKNGYIQNNPQALGVSDTGESLNLDAGSYLFTVAGFDYIPWASFNGAGTVNEGFVDSNALFFGVDPARQWSSWAFNTGGAPSPYEVYIDGDVSATVSSVPVPAAVWFMGSAMLGLVGVRRKQK